MSDEMPTLAEFEVRGEPTYMRDDAAFVHWQASIGAEHWLPDMATMAMNLNALSVRYDLRPRGFPRYHLTEANMCPRDADLFAGDEFTVGHTDDVVVYDGVTWRVCVRCGRTERA